MMTSIILRPAEPDRDFGQLAAWFAILEENAQSEQALKEYYEKRRERIIQRVAANGAGDLLGFYWLYRSIPEIFDIDLFVSPDQRRQGVGCRLYADLEHSAGGAGAKKLRVTLPDTDTHSRAFAERLGFTERSHSIAMALDLDAFDDRPYDELIARLKGDGFQFISMEELGNTEEAQHKLYDLNVTAAMETLGADGTPPWDSFEDFQQGVCRSKWYRPAGQMVVIDTATGLWAAMSAITRFEGADFAYNLFTGVDKRYRGRKLAQAVKVLALRFARNILQVHSVHTTHNSKNLPILAIDRKFGYLQTSGTFSMAKILE